MWYQRILVLLLSLAMAFSSTNPHRASAATVGEVLLGQSQEEEYEPNVTEEEYAAVEQMVLELRETEEEQNPREIAAVNAIRVQMALQDEERRIAAASVAKVEAQTAATEAAAESIEASGKLRLSQDDLEILYKIVQAEAGDQSLKGRIMVVNVIINRVRSSNFPNSVRGVVFQKSQFSPVASGSYYTAKPDERTKRAVQAAVNGEDYSQGAIYFCTRSIAGRFSRYFHRVAAEGDHVFFK